MSRYHRSKTPSKTSDREDLRSQTSSTAPTEARFPLAISKTVKPADVIVRDCFDNDQDSRSGRIDLLHKGNDIAYSSRKPISPTLDQFISSSAVPRVEKQQLFESVSCTPTSDKRVSSSSVINLDVKKEANNSPRHSEAIVKSSRRMHGNSVKPDADLFARKRVLPFSERQDFAPVVSPRVIERKRKSDFDNISSAVSITFSEDDVSCDEASSDSSESDDYESIPPSLLPTKSKKTLAAEAKARKAADKEEVESIVKKNRKKVMKLVSCCLVPIAAVSLLRRAIEALL